VKYTVNWVEKNLGVTRKVLRIYEEKGLMDKTTFQNPDNKYRVYSYEDIERIWCYRLLQGVGYSLNDIAEMTQNADFDFQASLSDKIIDLERKRTEIEQYIGFAKALKLTGSFPLPKEIGSIRFDDFIKQAREYWNVNTDPQMASLQDLAETILNKSELTEADVQQAEALMDGYDMEAILMLHEYYDGLVKCKELRISHPVVQTLANLIYRHHCEHFFPAEVVESMTTQKFARHVVRTFTVGDIAVMQERNYGKDGCKFISEALAHFGGYSSIYEID
jgi:DNA-binding transcriptional MerR regulator